MLTLLNMTRTELLPMVLGAQTEHVMLNIHIYEAGDSLLIVGRNDELNRELGFAITMKAIKECYYRVQVPSALRHLIYLLEYNPPPEEVEEFNRRVRSDPRTVH